jgi:plastocyanin
VSAVVRHRSRLVAASALAAAALLAACGGGGGGARYVEPKGPAEATFRLDAGNFFFRPDEVTSPRGIVRFRIDNVQSGVHTLVIRGVPGYELRVSGKGDADAGKVDLSVLDPGEHEFYCTIPGHRQAGMKGTLTVR